MKNITLNGKTAAALENAARLDGVRAVRVRDLKRGDFFTVTPCAFPADNRVYIRGEYDKSERRYYCEKFADFCNGREFNGEKVVYTGFTF